MTRTPQVELPGMKTEKGANYLVTLENDGFHTHVSGNVLTYKHKILKHAGLDSMKMKKRAAKNVFEYMDSEITGGNAQKAYLDILGAMTKDPKICEQYPQLQKLLENILLKGKGGIPEYKILSKLIDTYEKGIHVEYSGLECDGKPVQLDQEQLTKVHNDAAYQTYKKDKSHNCMTIPNLIAGIPNPLYPGWPINLAIGIASLVTDKSGKRHYKKSPFGHRYQDQAKLVY